MEHCSALVQNISECLPNLNTPWTIPTDYSVKSPCARWIQAYVSSWMAPAFCIPGIAQFWGCFLVDTCPECHHAVPAAAGHKASWGHHHTSTQHLPCTEEHGEPFCVASSWGGSLPISFNKPKRALLQALLIKPLLSISILIPDGQTPPAASVQFPTLFSHPALFISSCFSFWYTKKNAASIDLLHTFSTTRLTSRSPLLNFIGPLCSLISSSFSD